MIVLGIESSCDETSCSVVRSGRDILSNIVSSQIDLHEVYGGVVPELACRRHIDVMIPTIKAAVNHGNIALKDVDLIAVTYGPGLIGALMLGVNGAKTLAMALNKPLIAVNHVEAHLYAAIMSSAHDISFPCLGVILSGGHTAIILMRAIGVYELISETVDDAVGEAFDKTSKILGLGYPGGPIIEQLAKSGNPTKYPFKAGTIKNRPLDFSFSGLKTAVLYAARGQNGQMNENIAIPDDVKADIAASFQEAAFMQIINKTDLIAKTYNCNTILFGGGVTNSQTLRAKFKKHTPYYNLVWPTFDLSLDNAAMIAGLGYHDYLRKGPTNVMSLEPVSRIPFVKINSTF